MHPVPIISSLVRIGVAAALLAFAAVAAGQGAPGGWAPVPGHIVTRWAKDVNPANPLPEYPRPQMRRREWQSLNGLWDFAVTPIDAPKPAKWDGKILVPFPIESSLSGVCKWLIPKSSLVYHRTFRVPQAWAGRDVLIHFGAVDFVAAARVDGSDVGVLHKGGYDDFALLAGKLKPGIAHDLVVTVQDETGPGQARGKQSLHPEGCIYSPMSGIWQTVWMEPIPDSSISAIKIVPDVDAGVLHLNAEIQGSAEGLECRAIASDGKGVIGQAAGPAGAALNVAIPHPKLWSPDHPFLYDLRVGLFRNGRIVDQVESYFGMRKIALGKDANGITRPMLNGKFVFQVGPLDQGFWPDGIYTAPTDEALRWDIEQMKRLGCNMVRKHVKVEPDRWYYWCDKLGLLVWQDMPSAWDTGDGQPASDALSSWRVQFEHEMDRMIEGRWNHPSIVMWIPFNEGWGQYDTERIVAHIHELDPSRLIDDATGGVDKNVGDMIDIHVYPGPGCPKSEEHRAAVLGEFGGLGYGVPGHTWSTKTWGYREFRDADALARRYADLLRKVYVLRDREGLSACVYTQLTDIETECNGYFTYDREVEKMPATIVAAANRGHFAAIPILKPIVPTAQQAPAMWRYTIEKPPADWFKPEFDAVAWQEGRSGFGTYGTPGALVSTVWTADDIWLRRTFTLPVMDLSKLKLWLHHDEDVEVYVNGVLAFSAPGYATEYDDYDLNADGRRALKIGLNTLAVHCHQTVGGQYIDVGFVEEVPPNRR